MASAFATSSATSASSSSFRRLAGRIVFPFPLGGMGYAAMCLLIMLLSLLQSKWWLSWPPAVWNDVEIRMRESQLAGSLVAGAYAAMQARAFGVNSVLSPPSAGRGVTRRVCRVCALSWLGCVVPYAVGFVPLIVVTAKAQGLARCDVLALASILLGVGMWPVIAFLIGVLTSRLASYLSLSVALVVITVVSTVPMALSVNSTGRSYLALSARWGLDFPRVGDVTAPVVTWARMAFFAVVTICMVMIAIGVLSVSRLPERLGAACWLVPPAAMVALVIAMQPNIVAPDPRSSAVCETRGDITICVEWYYRRQLPVMMDVDYNAYRLFDPGERHMLIGPGLLGAYSRTIPGMPQPVDRNRWRLNNANIGIALSEREFRSQLVADVAGDLSGDGHQCSAGVDIDKSAARHRLYELMRRKIGGNLVDADFVAWYRRHDKQIRACEWTDDMLEEIAIYER